MTHGSIRRTAVVVGAAVLGLAAEPVSAWTLRLEAESFVASHNVVPNDITVSNGVLYGLDFDGEWTRYDVASMPAGRYGVIVKCWGENYVPYHLRLTLESPPEPTQSVDLRFIGHGTCGG